jgi:hypothetical protein
MKHGKPHDRFAPWAVVLKPRRRLTWLEEAVPKGQRRPQRGSARVVGDTREQVVTTTTAGRSDDSQVVLWTAVTGEAVDDEGRGLVTVQCAPRLAS